MLARVRKDVYTPERLEVVSEGDVVRVSIGNTDMRFHYVDAFTIVNMMRAAAKAAKSFAGDTSRHWSVIGTMHNATPDQYGKTFNIRR
jgi:hypothetical protein